MANCEQILTSDKATKVRDEQIDSVKYWLIVLVIAGHVFMEKPFSGITSCAVVWKWIYLFHMPLFVFLSGYFSKKEGNNTYFCKSIWKLLEPLLIFQTVVILSKLLFSGYVSLNDIFTPRWILWYLLSLIYWRLIAKNGRYPPTQNGDIRSLF